MSNKLFSEIIIRWHRVKASAIFLIEILCNVIMYQSHPAKKDWIVGRVPIMRSQSWSRYDIANPIKWSRIHRILYVSECSNSLFSVHPNCNNITIQVELTRKHLWMFFVKQTKPSILNRWRLGINLMDSQYLVKKDCIQSLQPRNP